MTKFNRRSNFILGNDPDNFTQTTSNQAYSSKLDWNQGSSGSFSANSLRRGNFRLGFEKMNTYETTAQSNFTNKNEEAMANKQPSFKDKKNNMAQNMYGYTKPTYQTTNNSNFTAKDISESFKDKGISKERGKALKQSNFSFGHFENRNTPNAIPPGLQEHAKQFHAELAKQNQIAKLRGQELKKSNFTFSESSKPDDGKDTFKSMVQIQFDEETMKGDNIKQMKNQNKEISENLQKDLRSSHFHFGNNNSALESCSHNNHPKFNIDRKGIEESEKLAKKMQSANFVLGDQKNREMPKSSTYKDSISNTACFISMPRDKNYSESK